MVQIHPDPPVELYLVSRSASGVFRGSGAAMRQATMLQTGNNGAIAQLGEHLLCKQGVGGSIPPGSTRLKRRIDQSAQ